MNTKKRVSKMLTSLGLSPKEQTLYTTALSTGPVTVQQLSDHSGINRSTIYLYIDTLKEKGLLSESISGKTRRLVAEDPEVLSDLWQQKQTDADHVQSTLDSISQAFPACKEFLSDMAAHGGTMTKPIVRVYHGVEDVQKSYEHILNHAKKEVRSYFCADTTVHPQLEKNLQHFSQKRAERGIFNRSIIPKSADAQWYVDRQDGLHMQVRIMNTSQPIAINAELNLYEDYLHCMCFQGTGGFAIIIQNPMMVRLLGSFYDALWHQLPEGTQTEMHMK